jgi:hypothetical protein
MNATLINKVFSVDITYRKTLDNSLASLMTMMFKDEETIKE